MWAIVFGFIKEDYAIKTVFGTLSVNERCANANEVVFIFLAKQAVLTCLKGSKQCIVAHVFPFVEWKSNGNETLAKDVRTTAVPQ